MKRTTQQKERDGVYAVAAAFTEMGWAFREQPVVDQGIDAQVELDALTNASTGRLLAVQIKCGSSYFDRPTAAGWRYPGTERHLSYWLAHLLPMILVLVDPDTRIAYWVQVTHDAVHYTDRGWSIEVPRAHVLNAQAADHLRAIAMAGTPADPIERALPLLPPTAVELLSALRDGDLEGALRLAKFLSDGRHQPRATVGALLAVGRHWPVPTVAGRLAVIGAYANDHGHRDLAMTAFTRAAGQPGTDGVRLRGIAAVMATAGGDHDQAAELVQAVRGRPSVDLLAEAAVRIVDADIAAREDALETWLATIPEERLDAEPTCLIFLAERAAARSDVDGALALYGRACRSRPELVSGRLGQARMLIERVLQGRSAVPHSDQRKAVDLATSVRDELREWAGPSETAHRIIVQERMLAQGFGEVVALATAFGAGGLACDREAADPVVAAAGASACVALGNRAGAARFADEVRGTLAEPLLNAITADPQQPREQVAGLWRAALCSADAAPATRTCLLHLAALGALTGEDLDRYGNLARLDGPDRLIIEARNSAAAGDLDTAVAVLQAQPSPAAGEILVELLAGAGRIDEAVAVCDRTWHRYGTLKALQDKVNILAQAGDLDAAEACAAQLLASPELPPDHRCQIHRRMIDRRAHIGDWAGVETCCRAALRDLGNQRDDELAWALICAQCNQDRWDAAWDTYRQLLPPVEEPGLVRAWVELHLRFGITVQSEAVAATLYTRFGDDLDVLAQLARLGKPMP